MTARRNFAQLMSNDRPAMTAFNAMPADTRATVSTARPNTSGLADSAPE